MAPVDVTAGFPVVTLGGPWKPEYKHDVNKACTYIEMAYIKDYTTTQKALAWVAAI